MKMENIMDYRVFIYIIMLFITMFCLSGINYTGFFKTKHELEAKLFILITSLGISYIASQFIINFIELI